ncbi:MAG: hypothetical protein RIM72_01730 [Alphaproteobacteria bacterium]
MSTIFLTAFSKTLHRRFARLVLATGAVALALALTVTAPARAQEQQQDDLANEVDAVTKRVLTDPFITLRFVALTLETDDEQGQALNGLVRAMLVRGDRDSALEEIERIKDPLWKARSLVAYGEDYEKDGDVETALSYYQDAIRTIDAVPDLRDGGRLFRNLAEKQAQYGLLEDAIETAEKIDTPTGRVDALQNAAAKFYGDGARDAASADAAKAVLSAAYEQATEIEDTSQKTSNTLMDIAKSQASVGDFVGAQKTLQYARGFIERSDEKGRSKAMARLAATMILGKQLQDAMTVLREIPDGPDRAYGVSSVARALGETGNADAAVPLFTLAYEEAMRIEKDSVRYRQLRHIVEEQTRVGRLADAFTTAGSIRERIPQAVALLRMGKILAEQGNYEQSQLLAENYIPYLGLRAQLFGQLAMAHGAEGRAGQAKFLLNKAFEATGFPPLVWALPKAIRIVLNAQIEYGDPINDEEIFLRARELTDLIDDRLQRVAVQTYLATAQAQRGFSDQANKTLSSAWRSAWLNRKDKSFPKVLSDIVVGQLATGDILSAFDTAARIPAPEGEALTARAPDGSYTAPRFMALTRVAAAAARTGETELAIRAARQIEHPPARAAGLAAVAMSIKKSEFATDSPPDEESGADEFIGGDDLEDEAFQN